MVTQARSSAATVTGLRPSTRCAESPRPIPISIRPPEISLSVAIADAVTVGSLVTGLVTHVPEVDALGSRGHQREDRVDVLPQHVAVPHPRVTEAILLGEHGPADRFPMRADRP